MSLFFHVTATNQRLKGGDQLPTEREKMSSPIALQLYTLRESMVNDFEGVVRRVAAMGYIGVETAGFPGTTPEKASRLFQSLGLAVPGAHLPMPVGDQKQASLDTANALGTKRMINGLGPDHFTSVDKIKAACDQFNAAGAVAAEHGFTFGIHNHWWEFLQVEGRLVCDIMLEHLEPSVFFELDVYWVQTGGADPVDVVKRLGKRAPILHIKDGSCNREEPMTAVGKGKVNIPGVIGAGVGSSEWLIVELDRCATDMADAVEQSYRYLVDNGLGSGRS